MALKKNPNPFQYTERARLIKDLRGIIAPRDQQRSKWLCIHELTDMELVSAWELHQRKVTMRSIAEKICKDWRPTWKARPHDVANALRAAFNKLIEVQEGNLVKIVDANEVTRKAKSQLATLRLQYEALEKQIEEQFNPLAELAKLINLQRERIKEARKREKVENEREPGIDNMIEKQRTMIKEFANIAEMLGMYKGTKDDASGIRTVHLHLEQNILNPQDVKSVVRNFTQQLESLATVEIDEDGDVIDITAGAQLERLASTNSKQ